MDDRSPIPAALPAPIRRHDGDNLEVPAGSEFDSKAFLSLLGRIGPTYAGYTLKLR